MGEPDFQDVQNTHNDLVDITVAGDTVRIKNSHIVDQAVRYLCKCPPDVRREVIKELENPNQWALSSIPEHITPCTNEEYQEFMAIPITNNVFRSLSVYLVELQIKMEHLELAMAKVTNN